MLDERKTAILRAVVQEYIATAQPVGSTHIASAPGVRVSSATVRNEMAVLEQEGYLAQPHTSAGRVPTDKGYRFFVDHLAEPGRLDELASQRVKDFFHSAGSRLEEMLHDTSTLLTQLTNYAAVVVGPAQETAVVRSAQIVQLSSRVAMAVAVLSSGVVDSATVELADDCDESHVLAASSHLASRLVGSALATAAMRPSGSAEVDALCVTSLAALQRESDGQQVFLGGTSHMAQAFDAVQVVRQVLQVLEQQYVVVTLMRDILDRGLSVAIGAEHGVEPLAACSVVVAPVVVDGEQLGSIGVLGPTRMNYPQALATVEVVSDHLGRRLTEG